MLLPDQIYTWIEHIIISCNSNFQFVCVGELIGLFRRRFPEEITLSASLGQLRSSHGQAIQKMEATNIYLWLNFYFIYLFSNNLKQTTITMGLENTTKLTYLSISAGKICRCVPQATLNSISRTNKKSVLVHGEYYDCISSIIRDIRTKSHEGYGDFWGLCVGDGERLYILRFKYSSGYANGFLRAIKNANLLGRLTLIPHGKEENGKTKNTLFITRFGKALKHYYTKENAGVPPLKQIKMRGIVRWDGTDTMEFLERMVQTGIKPLLSGDISKGAFPETGYTALTRETLSF